MPTVTSATKFFPTAKEGFTTTLASTISSGAATVPLNSVTGFSNGDTVVLVVDPTVTDKKQAFTGIVDTAGVQITNVVWTEGTNQTHTSGSTVVDYETATHWALYSKGLLVEHEQDGTHAVELVTSRTEDTDPDPDADFVLTYDTSAAALRKAKLSNLSGAADGWVKNVLPAVSSVTYNGNRSYDVVFASTVASILSPGMRLKGTKTVAGNGYMGGAFNGSSHYFVKTSPTSTLASVTDNFTIMANVQPTAYAAGVIAARADATPANQFSLEMSATGQVYCAVRNGGNANLRYIQTYQSLPLNKKTHVAASWAAGVVVIYFDGVSVPVAAAVTTGTAPTTAGTTGDFAIGRTGASGSNYFTGYISNVGVFNAVLSASTIKQHATYKLLGSETNCIGAWSLDNTGVNQQAAGTNDLTATGGVSYTAISPHGQMGDALHTDQFAALVMSVSTTTATVQLPEGCTIPTSGGVSAVAYSVQGNPFGWVSDKGRWEVVTLYKTTIVQASATTAVVYNPAGVAITVPVGAFQVGFEVQATGTGSTGVDKNLEVQLSTSSSSITLDDLYTEFFNTVFVIRGTFARNNYLANFTAATPLYLLFRLNGAGTLSSVGIVNTNQSKVYALPTGL